MLSQQHITVNTRAFLCHPAVLWNMYVNLCIWFGPAGGKQVSKRRKSPTFFIFTQKKLKPTYDSRVVLVTMKPCELCPCPKSLFIHTQNHPQTQSPRTAPEIHAKVIEILFVVAKQNIPELWTSPCIISAASSAPLCIASSLPLSNVRQLLH